MRFSVVLVCLMALLVSSASACLRVRMEYWNKDWPENKNIPHGLSHIAITVEDNGRVVCSNSKVPMSRPNVHYIPCQQNFWARAELHGEDSSKRTSQNWVFEFTTQDSIGRRATYRFDNFRKEAATYHRHRESGFLGYTRASADNYGC